MMMSRLGAHRRSPEDVSAVLVKARLPKIANLRLIANPACWELENSLDSIRVTRDTSTIAAVAEIQLSKTPQRLPLPV
jgi:hypothetical protein